LIFIKRLDEEHTREKRKAEALGAPLERRIVRPARGADPHDPNRAWGES